MSALLQRSRGSGKCPPSLLSEDRVFNEDQFDGTILNLMPTTDFSLRSDDNVSHDFISIVKNCGSIDKLPQSVPRELRSKALEYRRCILLTLVGATHKDNPSVTKILSRGYLTEVRGWLEDALSGRCGGVDFILHLLSSIPNLPVTKDIIKDSGLGKAVGSLEKHSTFRNSPNLNAVASRVQKIKDSWHARVKAQKMIDAVVPNSETSKHLKRPAESSASDIQAKKTKASAQNDEPKKVSAFSSLLKKVNPSQVLSSSPSKELPMESKLKAESVTETETIKNDQKSKKAARRVKWADHFGGEISLVKYEGDDETSTPLNHTSETTAAWSESKKRDRLREKELLSTAKKSKLIDDDDDEAFEPLKIMKASSPWKTPPLLQHRDDIAKANLESLEIRKQEERMKSVAAANYRSESDVPSSPTPLNDAEQALDMTSHSAAVVAEIPFFVPLPPTPAPAPIAAPLPAAPVHISAPITYQQKSQPYLQPVSQYIPSTYDDIATPQLVQSLGLPMFLVGQSKSALQTLASSPSLLSTLVDANGMYDQPRLMSLVHTLAASANGARAAAPAPYQPPQINNFSNGASVSTSRYSQTPTYVKPSSSKSTEGNLHVSGYGPGTGEAELIAHFSPYVKIDEIVFKGSFSFVNTSDPPAAARAREALNGTLICGMPIRINQATRKARDGSTVPTTQAYGPGGAALNSVSAYGAGASSNVPVPVTMPPQFLRPGSMTPAGMPNVDAARDDRGNPATKNLFIAGYGPGTTEQQLRDLISQFVSVVGVVTKGTFSFVNTTDRESAVYAREMLGGMMLNGGAIRINFAKETGRLGTSFDLTYGPNTGPNAQRISDGVPRHNPNENVYGRSSIGY